MLVPEGAAGKGREGKGSCRRKKSRGLKVAGSVD
jgi:hypothetical protein